MYDAQISVTCYLLYIRGDYELVVELLHCGINQLLCRLEVVIYLAEVDLHTSGNRSLSGW